MLLQYKSNVENSRRWEQNFKASHVVIDPHEVLYYDQTRQQVQLTFQRKEGPSSSTLFALPEDLVLDDLRFCVLEWERMESGCDVHVDTRHLALAHILSLGWQVCLSEATVGAQSNSVFILPVHLRGAWAKGAPCTEL